MLTNYAQRPGRWWVQGVLLLLSAGNLDQLLVLLTEDKPMTPDAHLLGKQATCQRIDEELQSWIGAAAPSASPLLLAFAAFLSLAAMLPGA